MLAHTQLTAACLALATALTLAPCAGFTHVHAPTRVRVSAASSWSGSAVSMMADQSPRNPLARFVARFTGGGNSVETATAPAPAPAPEVPAAESTSAVAVVEPPVEEAEEEVEPPPPAPEPLFLAADAMHEEFVVKPLYDKLEEAAKERTDLGAELLWRRARCHYEMATQARSPAEQKALAQKGLQLAKQALAADPENGYAHKWVGILLGRVASFLPPNLKMANAFIIRERLDEAVARLPEDASVHLALGEWCAKVASLNLVERFFSSVVFGEPPSTTFDEALVHYRRAWELRPSRYLADKGAEVASRAESVSEQEVSEWKQRRIDTPPGPRDMVGATLREMSVI